MSPGGVRGLVYPPHLLRRRHLLKGILMQSCEAGDPFPCQCPPLRGGSASIPLSVSFDFAMSDQAEVHHLSREKLQGAIGWAIILIKACFIDNQYWRLRIRDLVFDEKRIIASQSHLYGGQIILDFDPAAMSEKVKERLSHTWLQGLFFGKVILKDPGWNVVDRINHRIAVCGENLMNLQNPVRWCELQLLHTVLIGPIDLR